MTFKVSIDALGEDPDLNLKLLTGRELGLVCG